MTDVAAGTRPLLVVDTATTTIVAGLATIDGRLVGETEWSAGHRHGETLLPSIEAFLRERGIDRDGIGGVIVGTGPGAFTGLRVGLATAKGIATALSLPIVGVSTADALIRAAERAGLGDAQDLVLLLPAGPWDRVVARIGMPATLLPGGSDPTDPADAIVAVDLDGRAPIEAIARGEEARRGLAAALADLGAERLRELPAGDDLARLAPEYVTLPRGVRTVPPDGVHLAVG